MKGKSIILAGGSGGLGHAVAEAVAEFVEAFFWIVVDEGALLGQRFLVGGVGFGLVFDQIVVECPGVGVGVEIGFGVAEAFAVAEHFFQ